MADVPQSLPEEKVKMADVPRHLSKNSAEYLYLALFLFYTQIKKYD